MRKVMHHSEEICLFVLISKLITHFISEPPHGYQLLSLASLWFVFFCYSPLIYFCLGSSFLVQLFVGLEEIIDRTRWWGLPIGDPTLMRTEFTLRSKTFAADGSIFPFSSPPILKLLFCFIDEIVPHCLCYSLFFIDESQIPYVKLQDASEGCGALTTWSNATPRVNTK